MTREDTWPDSGWWSADVPDVSAGIDYGFRLDGGEPLAGSPFAAAAVRHPGPEPHL